MLHPKQNRLDYGEQLVPPDGYELAYAVGTTYSLDLEALVVLPVALFYAQSLDTNPGEIRYDMLEAITQAADKITVFCQKGKILVPRKYHYLIAYWEKGIKEMVMPDGYSSFHPKVWVIRYEASDKPVMYRVIVTSRNLTFARDWDVAFSSEGIATRNTQESTQLLVDFLQYLATTGNRTFPSNFLKDLAKVKFDIPAGFESLDFFPIGIKAPIKRIFGFNLLGQGSKYENPLLHQKWEELLIISPFVDDKTISTFNQLSRKKLTLMSRKDELDSLNESIIKKQNCFQFSRLIEEAEHDESLSEAGIEEPSLQSLHAKIFIGEQEKAYHWFLGSANCTNPAFGRNVEFLVSLTGTIKSQRPRDIVDLLTNTAKSEVALFEPYDLEKRVSQSGLKEQEAAIRLLTYDLANIPVTGSVNQVAGGTVYDLTLEVDAKGLRIHSDFEVRLKPLSEKNKTAFTIEPGKLNTIAEYFTGYEERQLTPFIQWEIWFEGTCLKQFLVQIPITLPDSRLHKIFSFFIDNREKFLRYLTFLLSGEIPEIIPSSDDSEDSNSDPLSNNGANASMLSGAPVFEKLLLAASRSPHKLKNVDQLINRLKAENDGVEKDHIISPEFSELWEVFKVYLERSKS